MTVTAEFRGRNRFPILNTYVNALSMSETLDEIEGIIMRREPVQHVVINASKVNLMEDDHRLRAIVNECPLINADGASIVWAARMLGVPLHERVTGIDLFERLVERAATRGWKVFLFGAREEVVQETRRRFLAQYPNLEIVGVRNGYFDPEDNDEIVAQMAASQADLMFVAFSSPAKEFWVHENLGRLGIPFVMGVGGSFDVIAGVTQRAPMWLQRCGLEWFYRFAQEPRRLWRRYILGNARFVMTVLKYRLRQIKVR